VSDQNPAPTVPALRMSYEEWHAEGKRRFGDDFFGWKFVCPICKNVASVGDFRKYKHKGATPDSATCECIGCYQENPAIAFPIEGEKRGSPCNYALYGLFRFPGVIVTGSPHVKDGKEIMSFAFAEVT
jgi:hypothetical protein